MSTPENALPNVAFWRICILRLLYLLIAIGLTSFVWQQLMFESADWPLMQGIAKSMMGAIALLSFIGVFRPLKMLPLLIFEMLWKTLWIGFIAFPAWSNGLWTDGIESVFFECIGIIIIYVVVPWPYVWVRYIKHKDAPWMPRSNKV